MLLSFQMTTSSKQKFQQNKYSAGVLPVAWLGNQLLFLVGEDIHGSDDIENPISVCDFGGKSEKSDHGCHEYTASREFEEETLRMSITAKQMLNRLQNSSIKLISNTQNGHPYYMYVTSIPYSSALPKYMRKMMSFLYSKGLGRLYVEKRNVMWLTLSQLETIGKRTVFAKTLSKNRDIIQEIGACSPVQFEALIQRYRSGNKNK